MPPGHKPPHYNRDAVARAEEKGQEGGPVRKAAHRYSCGEIDIRSLTRLSVSAARRPRRLGIVGRVVGQPGLPLNPKVLRRPLGP